MKGLKSCGSDTVPVRPRFPAPVASRVSAFGVVFIFTPK